MEELVIKKVLKRSDGIKYLVIPKDSKIKGGDYVQVYKINSKEVKNGRKN